MSTLYAGPGKIYFNSIALQPEGENGPIRVSLNEETASIASAMFGRVGEQVQDQTVDISCTPFDNWGNLATLYPATLGVSVGATTGALAIGTRPHGAAHVPCKVWTQDGRIYDLVRAAVVGHPSLHLGVGRALFGDCRISCIGDETKALGTSSFLFASNAITETSGADPGGQMAMTDFIRGAWTGVWNTNGLGSDTVPIEAEDEWTIEFDVKYSSLKVQGLTRAMKLDSVNVMARVRPYGPTHTAIIAAVGAHTLGQRLETGDLVLTGPSSKTITLKKAGIRGAGFEFGGTSLGTGEIAFVTGMQFTTGAPQPLIIFSA